MTLDTRILRALRTAAPGAVSGADLAQQLKVTRAAIWARIEELRRLGYEITASPHGGYRLVSSPDLLHADDLLSRLPQARVIGRDIQVFRETTSTNDVIDRFARDGVAEGAVVFAESQTSGRGRLGRTWVSPKGKGLWFSVLLRPALRPQESTRLTIAAATALARAIRLHSHLPVAVKWPNDLLVAHRKIAGILTELSAEPDRIRYVILGIGVNANLTATDFPPDLRRLATSIRIETNRPVDRAALAVTILRELERDYTRTGTGQFEAVADEWEMLCSTLGRQVTIAIGERRIRGRAESLDPDGALLIRTEHGHLERILGGDVTLER